MIVSSRSSLSADLGILQVLVGEDHRVAPVHQGLHARHIVAHRVALSLVVMVLPGHPLGFFARVLDVFVLD